MTDNTSFSSIRTAVIGAGAMGKRHLQAAHDMGLSIVGICDQRTEALATVAAEFNLSADQQFTVAETMLEKAKADCVIVATTTPTHAPYTIAAAEAGARYILCEKPMADSLAACDQMIAVCDSRGAKLAINHQMRFLDYYQAVKAHMQTEAFGGLTSITVIAGNFGLAMNATHMFELLRYMTDETAVSVNAWFSPEIVPNPRGANFEDRAGSIRVVTKSGVRLYIEASSDQGHGLTLIFVGRYGQIVYDPLVGIMQTNARTIDNRLQPTTRYGLLSDRGEQKFAPVNAVAPTQQVLKALFTDGDYPTGADGRAAIRTLVAAYLSAENNSISTAVDDALPHQRVFPWA